MDWSDLPRTVGSGLPRTQDMEDLKEKWLIDNLARMGR